MTGSAVAIPTAVQRELEAYRDRHVAPSRTLRAILANDLFEAVGMLQPDPLAVPLFPVVRFIFNELPRAARGSYAEVDAWIAEGNTPK